MATFDIFPLRKNVHAKVETAFTITYPIGDDHTIICGWEHSVQPCFYQQMKEAYERGIEKIWILNVGDIKPAEYQTELFMDMAWNIGKVEKEGISNHLLSFPTT